MNSVLLPLVVSGLTVLTAGGWLLVQLRAQHARTLRRIEALESGLAAEEALWAARPVAATRSKLGDPPAARAPEIDRRGDRLPLPTMRLAPAPQISRGSCGSRAAASRLSVGDIAPTFVLPDLAGAAVDLAGFRGTTTLVLFWHPGCGYCRRMLSALKTWEANQSRGALRLLVVSTGSRDANLAMGLRATIVLDRGFSTGQSFGAVGTPSGVLVDDQGRIASLVAHGAPAVLSLGDALAPT